jgi:TatD DNase family protein
LAPLDRVLVETDAPYLTPMPFRGKPNASYLIPHTARFFAATLGVELEHICQALNDNADAAFGGSW